MPSNRAEYMKEYMKKYVTNSESVKCEVCQGKYKTYSKYNHLKTKKHLSAQNKTNEIKTSLSDEEIKAIKRMLNKQRASDAYDPD